MKKVLLTLLVSLVLLGSLTAGVMAAYYQEQGTDLRSAILQPVS